MLLDILIGNGLDRHVHFVFHYQVVDLGIHIDGVRIFTPVEKRHEFVALPSVAWKIGVHVYLHQSVRPVLFLCIADFRCFMNGICSLTLLLNFAFPPLNAILEIALLHLQQLLCPIFKVFDIGSLSTMVVNLWQFLLRVDSLQWPYIRCLYGLGLIWSTTSCLNNGNI